MKKSLKCVLALSLVLMLCIGLAACGDDGVVGKWNVTTMSSQGVTINLAEMGASMSFEFKKDGTGIAAENMSGTNETSNFTYSTSGSKITMTIDGETQTLDYKISGKTLTMDLTMDGQTMKLTMTKA